MPKTRFHLRTRVGGREEEEQTELSDHKVPFAPKPQRQRGNHAPDGERANCIIELIGRSGGTPLMAPLQMMVLMQRNLTIFQEAEDTQIQSSGSSRNYMEQITQSNNLDLKPFSPFNRTRPAGG